MTWTLVGQVAVLALVGAFVFVLIVAVLRAPRDQQRRSWSERQKIDPPTWKVSGDPGWRPRSASELLDSGED